MDDGNLLNSESFLEYIAKARRWIIERSKSWHSQSAELNTPFEYRPNTPTKKGILLVHGLLDTPFSMQELGRFFLAQGFLVRALLLPGHGTAPEDLLTVKAQDWINAVAFGMKTLAKEVEESYILGMSTGAALAIDYALSHSVTALFLLSPAIQIKSRFAALSRFPVLLQRYIPRAGWLSHLPEDDCVKYRSFPFNAAYQVYQLTKRIQRKPLSTPFMMAITEQDETVSAKASLDYFQQQKNSNNRLLCYTTEPRPFSDSRIRCQNSLIQEKHILSFSHVSLPIAPSNWHYGEKGKYTQFTQHRLKTEMLGAISDAQERFGRLNLARLFYNPYFSEMTEFMKEFLAVLKK